MTEKNNTYEFEIRVSYADTDRMGVVYYGNYFTLFEKGRTELMRERGLRYKDLEEKEKIFLPASEARCRYFAPAHYDELIRIRTRVEKLGPAHMDFTYEIFNSETNKRLAEGFTRHPFVNEKWKPVRAPKSVKDTFASS